MRGCQAQEGILVWLGPGPHCLCSVENLFAKILSWGELLICKEDWILEQQVLEFALFSFSIGLHNRKYSLVVRSQWSTTCAETLLSLYPWRIWGTFANALPDHVSFGNKTVWLTRLLVNVKIKNSIWRTQNCPWHSVSTKCCCWSLFPPLKKTHSKG